MMPCTRMFCISTGAMSISPVRPDNTPDQADPFRTA
jgi:hypothetical protein